MNHSEETIHQSMGSRWADVPVQALSETDSTNTRLKEWAREGRIAAPYVLTADSQTAGRGRLGRQFVSPPGTGLYMSLFFSLPPWDPGLTAILAAVAACRAIEELTDARPKIKWVNDLFFRGKKICGILAERIDEGIILGVGVNLRRMTPRPGEIRSAVERVLGDPRHRRAAGRIAAAAGNSAAYADRGRRRKWAVFRAAHI